MSQLSDLHKETVEHNSISKDQEEVSEVSSGLESKSQLESESESDSESDSSLDEEYANESLSNIIIDEISNGTYTCLVCTLEIDRTSQVWSCDNCYRVYDLDCIKDWAVNGSSTVGKKWRCPSCNIEKNKVPSKFTCWCGKVSNPESDSLIPFSCDNLCGKQYDNCIHKCSSVCHPGSHPLCGALGPSIKCNCGCFEKQVPCIITPYDGWSCDEPCNNVVCDFNHKCEKLCHDGFCGNCDDVITGKCYCGKDDDRRIKCMDKQLKSSNDNKSNKWIGIAKCDQTTKRYYDCNIHYEELECQPYPLKTKICENSPKVKNTCHCGKTMINATHRTKCTDPIPTCESECGKLLPCGCTCLLQCHPGDCECHNIFYDVKCGCKNYSFAVPCKAIQNGFVPKCRHKCPVLMNCRKHYHRIECCPYEKHALDRERVKKKAIRNRTISNVNNEDEIMTMEPVHICTKTCNRLKSCGKHTCSAFCHPGPCDVCLESTNEDLICHCGKTIIEAPVRCGTKLQCHEQCNREKSCGHRPEIHECHDDSVDCPKCTALVTKLCQCGSKEMPNILCSLGTPSCDKLCQVLKNCGHPCLRPCSKDCIERGVHASSAFCQSACGKIRTNCPHRCKLKCHANKVGKSKSCDAQVCSEMVQITCECGRIEQSVRCEGSLTTKSNLDVTLECDEACQDHKRDEELRSAFVLDINDQNDDYKSIYDDEILTVYQKQTNWCLRIESFMRDFVGNEDSTKRSHHFPAMNSAQRKFIHGLANSYCLYSESQDPEPKRSVFIYINQRTKVPSLTIQQTLDKIEEDKQKEILQEEERAKILSLELFNSIIIQDVFLGVTEDTLKKSLVPLIETDKIEPLILGYSEGNFLLYVPEKYLTMTIEDENNLYLSMKLLRNIFKENSLAFDCKLCVIDSQKKVLQVDRSGARAKNKESKVMLETKENTFDLLQVE